MVMAEVTIFNVEQNYKELTKTAEQELKKAREARREAERLKNDREQLILKKAKEISKEDFAGKEEKLLKRCAAYEADAEYYKKVMLFFFVTAVAVTVIPMFI